MIKKVEILARWCAYLSGFTLAFVVLITTLHVALVLVDRFLFRTNGIVGLEEIVAMLTGLVFFSVLPYAQFQMVHVRVDFISLPDRMVQLVEKLTAMLFAAFYGGLSIALWQGLWQAHEEGMRTSVLSIPHWPFYLPALASCFLCALVALVRYSEK